MTRRPKVRGAARQNYVTEGDFWTGIMADLSLGVNCEKANIYLEVTV
jgi:hypothetical protein